MIPTALKVMKCPHCGENLTRIVGPSRIVTCSHCSRDFEVVKKV